MSKPARSKRKQGQDSNTMSPTIETPVEGNQPTFEQIRDRAYEIYLERGDASGSDLDDWLQAEHELTKSEGS
jgi:hypothetical protein